MISHIYFWVVAVLFGSDVLCASGNSGSNSISIFEPTGLPEATMEAQKVEVSLLNRWEDAVTDYGARLSKLEETMRSMPSRDEWKDHLDRRATSFEEGLHINESFVDQVEAMADNECIAPLIAVEKDVDELQEVVDRFAEMTLEIHALNQLIDDTGEGLLSLEHAIYPAAAAAGTWLHVQWIWIVLFSVISRLMI